MWVFLYKHVWRTAQKKCCWTHSTASTSSWCWWPLNAKIWGHFLPYIRGPEVHLHYFWWWWPQRSTFNGWGLRGSEFAVKPPGLLSPTPCSAKDRVQGAQEKGCHSCRNLLLRQELPLPLHKYISMYAVQIVVLLFSSTPAANQLSRLNYCAAAWMI